MTDRNNLAYWFPPLQAAGLPVPATEIVETDVNLLQLLDGNYPDGFDAFMKELEGAVKRIGLPCFLRTGHTSGKHEWRRTCMLSDRNRLGWHVAALVESSALADMFGLPTQTWVVRELIQTEPLFHCLNYEDFPVTREFRFFVENGAVTHWQPYWPAGACEQGKPDNDGWDVLLDEASQIDAPEREKLEALAIAAATAVDDGYWSVDLLQDAGGAWWITDMADGAQSFRYDRERAGV